MSAFLSYGRQSISEEDINEVVAVLHSDFLTQGPTVSRFEESVAGWCGAEYGVAFCNGTASLHSALRAMNLGNGDYFWTSPITFVASANAGIYCGGKVDFVDVEPGTALMCPERLEEKLGIAEKEGKLPKVVIPVHLAGQSCNMPRISALGQKYGFRILEDAAHALGGSYKGEKIGNCRYSDAVSHSFHPVKIITSGEGGMITTNDAELAWKMSNFRAHGITREENRMVGSSHGSWYYEQTELGYNYRITDIQAALGASQMLRLEEFASRRRELADVYARELNDFPVRTLERDLNGISGWHLYIIRLNLEEIGKTRRKVHENMLAQGIGVNVHYIPVHLQPYYTKMGFREGMFPEAERYYSECMTLPLFPAMKDADVYRVKDALKTALN